MTQWFGESWGAPACQETVKVETPIGTLCGWCDEEILERDRGFVIPSLDEGEQVVYHLECHLRQILGSVGHIEGRCSCVGGHAEDPPGVTPRQAAIAAIAAYERKYGWSII